MSGKAVTNFVKDLENLIIELKKKSYQKKVYFSKNMGAHSLQPEVEVNIKKCETQYIEERKTIDETIKILQEIIALFSAISTERNIFDAYGVVSDILYEKNYKAKDRFEIIMAMVQKNIDSGILNDSIEKVLLTEQDLITLHAEDKKFSEITEIIQSDREELSIKEQQIYDDFYKLYMSKRSEFEKNILLHRLIQNHYLNKKKTYNETDIKIVLKALAILEVSQENLVGFEAILINNMPKEKTKVKAMIPKKKEQELIDYRKNRMIFKEIKSLYDIDNKKTIRPLTVEEIIYLVSLLQKVKFTEEEVKQIIKHIYKDFGINYQNPIALFNALSSKMAYYQDNEEMTNAFITIKEFINELFIFEQSENPEEDYIFWKNEIEQEMTKVYPFLVHDYEFELTEARKLK